MILLVIMTVQGNSSSRIFKAFIMINAKMQGAIRQLNLLKKIRWS